MSFTVTQKHKLIKQIIDGAGFRLCISTRIQFPKYIYEVTSMCNVLSLEQIDSYMMALS